MTPRYHVELIKKNKGHYYQVEGEQDLFPGVTTALGIIAKPALIPWAANQAAMKIEAYLLEHAVERVLTAAEIKALVNAGRKHHIVLKETAAEVGTRAHQAIDDIINLRTPTIAEDIKPAVDAFLDWRKTSKIVVAGGDRKIASVLWQYGGSLDCLGEQDGKFVIVDFKTSSGIWDEYALQVAAYAQAFRETYDLPYLPEAYVLRLGKTSPEFEVKKVKDVGRSLQGFLSALRLHKITRTEHF